MYSPATVTTLVFLLGLLRGTRPLDLGKSKKVTLRSCPLERGIIGRQSHFSLPPMSPQYASNDVSFVPQRALAIVSLAVSLCGTSTYMAPNDRIVEPDSAVNRTFLTSPLNLPRPTLGNGRRVTTSAEQSCVELDIPLSVPFSPRLPSLSPFLLFSFPPLSRQQAFRCLVKATLRSRLHIVPPPNVILHWYSQCQSLPSHALRRTFHMYV